MPHTIIIDGNLTFQSDKYKWCPPGFVPLKVTDPDAHPCLAAYAMRHRIRDQEFSDDLLKVIKAQGFQVKPRMSLQFENAFGGAAKQVSKESCAQAMQIADNADDGELYVLYQAVVEELYNRLQGPS